MENTPNFSRNAKVTATVQFCEIQQRKSGPDQVIWTTIPKKDTQAIRESVDWARKDGETDQAHGERCEKALAKAHSETDSGYRDVIREHGSRGRVCVRVWFDDPKDREAALKELVLGANACRHYGAWMQIPTLEGTVVTENHRLNRKGKPNGEISYSIRWRQSDYCS